MILIGAGIDYSRISVVDAKLQSTLDQNILGMDILDFNNRAEMEKYIVSLAKVNINSETVQANISVQQDVLRVDLRDTVKTPMLNFIGKPEVEVLASVDLKHREATSTGTFTDTKAKPDTANKSNKISRSQINQMHRQISNAISKISSRNYSTQHKRRIITRLQKQLQKLKRMRQQIN